MFTDEEIQEIIEAEERERQIIKDMARKEVLDAEMLCYHSEELLYESLTQETCEEYCVPIWFKRRRYVE